MLLFICDPIISKSIADLTDSDDMKKIGAVLSAMAEADGIQAKAVFKIRALFVYGYGRMPANNEMEYDEKVIARAFENVLYSAVSTVKWCSGCCCLL